MLVSSPWNGCLFVFHSEVNCVVGLGAGREGGVTVVCACACLCVDKILWLLLRLLRLWWEGTPSPLLSLSLSSLPPGGVNRLSTSLHLHMVSVVKLLSSKGNLFTRMDGFFAAVLFHVLLLIVTLTLLHLLCAHFLLTMQVFDLHLLTH